MFTELLNVKLCISVVVRDITFRPLNPADIITRGLPHWHVIIRHCHPAVFAKNTYELHSELIGTFKYRTQRELSHCRRALGGSLRV